jgi:hypothetical protein
VFFYRKFAFFQLELLEFFGIFGFCFVILNKISNFGGEIAKKEIIQKLKNKLLGSKSGAQRDIPCSKCGAFFVVWHVLSSATLSCLLGFFFKCFFLPYSFPTCPLSPSYDLGVAGECL